MITFMQNTRCRRFVGLLIVVGLVGCGGSRAESNLASLNKSNLQRLVNLYFAYQRKHDFVGPPDETAFKEFLNAYNPDKLERIGVDPNAIDNLFVSDGDGQPFKIRYGVRGSMMGSSEPVVFESVGKGEKLRVGFLDMTQREVDQAEYDQLWNGKGVNNRAGASRVPSQR